MLGLFSRTTQAKHGKIFLRISYYMAKVQKIIEKRKKFMLNNVKGFGAYHFAR